MPAASGMLSRRPSTRTRWLGLGLGLGFGSGCMHMHMHVCMAASWCGRAARWGYHSSGTTAWSKYSLGSAPARLLCLPRAGSPGGYGQLGTPSKRRAGPTDRPATASEIIELAASYPADFTAFDRLGTSWNGSGRHVPLPSHLRPLRRLVARIIVFFLYSPWSFPDPVYRIEARGVLVTAAIRSCALASKCTDLPRLWDPPIIGGRPLAVWSLHRALVVAHGKLQVNSIRLTAWRASQKVGDEPSYARRAPP
eukprot:scaffold10588_cov26-Phaeocystis_antarctica.AAC.1